MGTAIDVLEYMLPDQVWAFENYLAVENADKSIGQPIIITVMGNQIWEMKGPQGFPWDMNTFDELFVYQSINSIDSSPGSWQDQHMYKIFCSKSWPGANGGIVWSPRYFYPDMFNPPVITGDSSYRTYTDCQTFVTQDLGGSVETHIEGPYLINAGLDLGVVSCVVQSYKWGQSLELNYYAKQRGRCLWEKFNLVNGAYQLVQSVPFNKVVKGKPPLVNFPCPIPTFP